MRFLLILLVTASSVFSAALDISQLPADDIKKGVAVLAEKGDFLFAFESAKQPTLVVDDQKMPPMKRAGGGPWTYSGKLKTGTSHYFYYLVDGQKVGGLTDVPAFGPDSYTQAGVPQGRLSEKMTHTSRVYAGMKSDYWIYIPAQYNAATPAALMVFQDGHYHLDRDGSAQAPTSGQPPSRLQNVIDNLTQRKQIPVAIYLFIEPGKIGDRAMRSIEYDTVSDTYPRFLRDEIMPEIYAKYNIRKDPYSRAIAGNSSGGICAFNAGWYHPDQYSRVLMRVPSFTGLQWQPGVRDGGNIYPFRVRKEEKRNLRVWMQDGSEDQEAASGSWPLQNIQMANSLKLRGYDFHFSYGTGTHNHAQNNSEMPEALAWLWRDYDPSRTEQVYEMEPAEKAKPVFRVRIYNRE